MKKRYYILVVTMFLTAFQSFGEITVEGTVSEIKKEYGNSEKEYTISIKGEYSQKIEPEHYLLEGIVYSRGKNYSDVVQYNNQKIGEVKELVSKTGALEYIERNSINIAGGELAVSELKELELQTGFRVKSESLKEIEELLMKLSENEGIIIKEIVTIVEITAEKKREGTKFAIEDLKKSQNMIEESLGVKLRLVRISFPTSFANPSRPNLDGDDEVFELSPFMVTSKRKWSERETKVTLEKRFFEKFYQYSVAGIYTLDTMN